MSHAHVWLLVNEKPRWLWLRFDAAEEDGSVLLLQLRHERVSADQKDHHKQANTVSRNRVDDHLMVSTLLHRRHSTLTQNSHRPDMLGSFIGRG
jgi:hypothetical protein